MPNISVSLRKIINFAFVGIFCLATFGGNHVHCSSLEEFGDEHFRFIKPAVKERSTHTVFYETEASGSSVLGKAHEGGFAGIISQSFRKGLYR